MTIVDVMMFCFLFVAEIAKAVHILLVNRTLENDLDRKTMERKGAIPIMLFGPQQLFLVMGPTLFRLPALLKSIGGKLHTEAEEWIKKQEQAEEECYRQDLDELYQARDDTPVEQ